MLSWGVVGRGIDRRFRFLAAWAVGLLVAATVVQGVTLDGRRWWVTAAVVAGGSALAGAGTGVLARRLLPGLWSRSIPVRVALVSLVVSPLAVWGVLLASGAVEVPMDVSGIGAWVVGGYTVLVVSKLVDSVWVLLFPWTPRGARRKVANRLADRVSAALALWAVLLLGGAELGPAEGWQQVVAVLALSVPLGTFGLVATGFGRAVNVLLILPNVVAKGALLWLVARIGSETDPSLTMTGFGTLAIGGLVVAIVTSVPAVLRASYDYSYREIGLKVPAEEADFKMSWEG
jgi:hypothetical protein